MRDRRDERGADALDQRVHDAYEQVSLSPEAEERILGALLAAQAARGEDADVDAAGQSDEAEAVEPAEILPGPAARRRPPLAIVLPAAACLVLAVIVGRAALGGIDRAADAAMTTEAVQEEAALEYEATAVDAGGYAEDKAANDEVPLASDAAADAAEESLAVATRVVLDTGEEHDLVYEDGVLVEVGPEVVGDTAGSGEAYSADGTFSWGCELFYPMDETGLAGFLVACPDGTNLYYLVDLAS